jgi:hypothetical protein
MRADVHAARGVVRGAQAVRGDAGNDRLHVLRDHLVAALEQRPGAGGVHERKRRARREAGDVVRRAARVFDDRLHVVEKRGRDVDAADAGLLLHQLGRRHAGLERLEEITPVGARKQRALGFAVRVAELDSHHEAIELRLRQRECAHLLGRILRRDDEEGRRQLSRLALGRDLVLFHRFEQRRLRLWRGAVHLIGEDDLREDRPGVELEAARVPLVDRDADDVGRQHVARELNSLEVKPERLCEHVRKRRLADAGQVFDQQMPARKQARERKANLRLFAQDDLARRLHDALDRRSREAWGLEIRLGLEKHAAIVRDALRWKLHARGICHARRLSQA